MSSKVYLVTNKQKDLEKRQVTQKFNPNSNEHRKLIWWSNSVLVTRINNNQPLNNSVITRENSNNTSCSSALLLWRNSIRVTIKCKTVRPISKNHLVHQTKDSNLSSLNQNYKTGFDLQVNERLQILFNTGIPRTGIQC